MKQFCLCCLVLFVCCSCIKERSIINNSAPQEIISEFLQKKSSVRSLNEAQDWATKSISLIEDSATKTSLHVRNIASWNVLTCANTKSDSNDCDTLLYVFNFENNQGFSIIAADAAETPILVVAEKGQYIPGEPTGNEAFDDYMGALSARLSDRLNNRGGPELYYWYEYETVGEVINRQVGVRWGQSDIYGKYCPNQVSGCVATAMAQIMAYHKRPYTFITTVEMSINNVIDYAVGDTVSLYWTGIKNHTVTHSGTWSCTPYHNNIGALLREIGDRVDMTYYSNGTSGAYTSDVPQAFSYFGYTTSSPTTFSVSSAKDAIKDYGPIYMSGYRTDSLGEHHGHAWVVDGYKDYMYYRYRYERAINEGEPPIMTQQTLMYEEHSFHINWGWDGNCNGYFNFGVFDVESANTYDYTHTITGRNYNNYLQMITVY